MKEHRLLSKKRSDATDIFRLSITDRYKVRPISQIPNFDDMCLAEYASYYEYFMNDIRKKKSTIKQLPLFNEDIYEEDEDEFLEALDQSWVIGSKNFRLSN